ncbi:acyltransferase [Actinopolymorpha alba]|uniref:acyltransferase n=1 Tax=Actinopolymorpha alba TaxID=533267 RepID=UPI00037E75F9|nr:acyltransferase [Actinopolymorpha alba]
MTPGFAPATEHFVAASADVDERAVIGAGSAIWHLAQVREGAVLGPDCIVGRGAYVGSGVRVGARVKIQNYALVYEPAVLEDGVFVGPAVVLTNDQYPRSVDPSGALKRSDDWDAVGVTVREGASLGARAVCVAPVTIGRWAMVAAGAVVTRDVPDFALVAGVPAKRVGWVGRAGVRLEADGDGPDRWRCPQTGEVYVEAEGILREGRNNAVGVGPTGEARGGRNNTVESETR